MTQDLNDIQMYRLYQTLNSKPLPKDHTPPKDLMELAEQAETTGDLMFLSQPLDHNFAPPDGLVTRALATGPRSIPWSMQTGRLAKWKQALAAVLTFLAFGSGSYALANGLSNNPIPADPLETNDTGIFDAIHASGFLNYE